MPTSRATAVWKGTLREGKGTYRAASGAFTADYGFHARFEGAKGSTPEELIAAAHAACYSMALAAALEKAGTPSTQIDTEAACTLEMVEGVPTVTTMALTVRGTVSGMSADAFRQAAAGAKDNCPVSRLLKPGLSISLDARLA